MYIANTHEATLRVFHMGASCKGVYPP